jgi:tripartite-type tricarboxylate transporter receptor subunit TctC
LAVSLGAIYTAAFAQADYPTRPIRLIAPFTAGGGVDAVARIVGEELKGVLGQSVVVENLPGASGMTGAETAVRAEPDGYILLVSSAGEAAVNPHLFKNIKYDSSRDLTPVTLVVSAASGMKSLNDLSRSPTATRTRHRSRSRETAESRERRAPATQGL